MYQLYRFSSTVQAVPQKMRPTQAYRPTVAFFLLRAITCYYVLLRVCTALKRPFWDVSVIPGNFGHGNKM